MAASVMRTFAELLVLPIKRNAIARPPENPRLTDTGFPTPMPTTRRG